MELLIETNKVKKQDILVDEDLFSNEKIIKIIGRDFNKSVSNIAGLVSLLDDNDISEQDFKTIKNLLSVEAFKLRFMVKEICS